jgi:Fe-S cluster assembly protein SufD
VNAAEHFVGDFRRFASRSAGRAPDWLADVRAAAIARFAEIGFPTTREEDWKYTNVSPVVKPAFQPAFEVEDAPAPEATTVLLGDRAACRLVFVNGRFVAGASALPALPSGVRVKSLAAALRDGGDAVGRHLARHARFDQNGFTALSTAFLEDGAFVELADGSGVEEPIEIVFVSSARRGEVAVYPRLLVVGGRDSRASLVERFVSDSPATTLSSPVAEIVLGDGARIFHVRVVSEGPRAAHVATTQVLAGRNARYSSSAWTLGAAFSRHNLQVRLDGEGAECSLDGLYVGSGAEFVDNHTAIDHAVPHGTSRELYKGVLGGRARAVFNGKVIVRPNAQRSDAQQTNKNLLLSRTAEIDSKPELQIFADDVKCTHGAAIGQLDPEALFYLESRGIGAQAGRRLLTRGFANELLQRIESEPVRSALEPALFERVERCLAEEPFDSAQDRR